MIVKNGKIKSGVYKGYSVFIEDDRNGTTGGFYVYLNDGKKVFFDYWFDNFDCVCNQLEEFEIEWSEE